ncbi:unnamed protein product [Pleuronectes platessa]|uniref:Uncharacterized protein n=1 Tax=Pleuronectes platessa TaxID=8262 RepID=A0A9N7U315_PLEPL|nr:unnamed protein product [Pleuronectes platessa]
MSLWILVLHPDDLCLDHAEFLETSFRLRFKQQQEVVGPMLSGSFTRSLVPLLALWFLHSLSGSFTRSLVPSLALWFLHSLSGSFTRSLVPSLALWFLHSLSGSFTRSLVPSLALWSISVLLHLVPGFSQTSS